MKITGTTALEAIAAYLKDRDEAGLTHDDMDDEERMESARGILAALSQAEPAGVAGQEGAIAWGYYQELPGRERKTALRFVPTKELADDLRENGVDVFPLGRLAEASPAPAGVQALEWDGNRATSVAGFYAIQRADGEWNLLRGQTDNFWKCIASGSAPTFSEAFEQAKAAAQADYETRIRSALIAPPAAGAQPVPVGSVVANDAGLGPDIEAILADESAVTDEERESLSAFGETDVLLLKLQRKVPGRDPNKYLATITIAEANFVAERLRRNDEVIYQQLNELEDLSRQVEALRLAAPPAAGAQAVPVACQCTLIKQDESCPVGYPSLLCDVCDGRGVVPATFQAVPSGWQDISTAPKDGTWVEAWRGSSPTGVWSNPVYVRWCQFDDGEGTWCWPDDTYDITSERGRDMADTHVHNGDCYEDAKSFTHWRLPPASPVGEER